VNDRYAKVKNKFKIQKQKSETNLNTVPVKIRNQLAQQQAEIERLKKKLEIINLMNRITVQSMGVEERGGEKTRGCLSSRGEGASYGSPLKESLCVMENNISSPGGGQPLYSVVGKNLKNGRFTKAGSGLRLVKNVKDERSEVFEGEDGEFEHFVKENNGDENGRELLEEK
jgi:hypothetical protein